MNFNDFFQPAVYISILLTYLIPKLSPHIDRFFVILKDLLVKKLPAKLRGYVQKVKLRRLQKLEADSKNIAAINYQISKANSAYLLFLGVALLYALLLILGLLKSLLGHGVWTALLIGLPIYLFEVLWLIQDAKARDLVKQAGRRIKS